MTSNITVSNNDGIQGGRRLPSSSDFMSLVRQACQLAVKDGKPFTAYSITTAIRANNPGLEIRHNESYGGLPGVQAAVHDTVIPQDYPAIPAWHQDWNGNTALTYFPPSNITVTKPVADTLTLGDDVNTLITGLKDDNRKPLKRVSSESEAVEAVTDDGTPDESGLIPVIPNTDLAKKKNIGQLGIPMLTDGD